MGQRQSDNFTFSRISELSELIRQQKLSPVDLVSSCLERIHHLQPRLNAFIAVTHESAIEEAITAKAEIRQGKWKGPLHGIPAGIKDFYDTAGIRTTAASEHFRNRVPKQDAASVQKLKNAGAIIVGKTNMHALGMGTTGLESCFGPARNPWNPDYIPGGSSSGSAAAVASGLCYLTLDTDAIGSCRLPAACCGIVGFKASYGLISVQGILDGEKPPDEQILWLSHAGISTRSIEDTAFVLDVLAERNRDQLGNFFTALNQERQLRIGVAKNCEPAPGATAAFETAVRTIRSFGYWMASVAAPRTDFSKGIAAIASDRQAIARQAFHDIDVLLLPTTATTTLMVKNADKPLALSPEYTMFANYYGLPAVSVPCGFDDHGLPLGLQMVAKPQDEGAILRLAHQFETATTHSKVHPTI
jgi:aspartyl-tRNA(Asn)/glutamyl-tRNA(Gln) amidotransferase subunit A